MVVLMNIMSDGRFISFFVSVNKQRLGLLIPADFQCIFINSVGLWPLFRAVMPLYVELSEHMHALSAGVNRTVIFFIAAP